MRPPQSVLSALTLKMVSPTYYARLRAALSLLQPRGTVLDAGCGMGEAMLQLSVMGARSVGIDIEIADLLRARDILRAYGCEHDLVRADTKLLPFKESTFNSAVCLEVLQYLDDDRACLDELHRVLAHEGKLVVSVPNRDFPIFYDPFNWLRARLGFNPIRVGIWFWGEQLRLYSRRSLIDRIARAGFRATEVRLTGTWLVPLVESYLSSLLYSITPSSEKPSYISKREASLRKPAEVRRRLHSLSPVLSFLVGVDERPRLPSGTHILVSATKSDQAQR